MKFTKDEYLRLGRTLQKRLSESLSEDSIKFTTIAIKYKNERYKTFYEIAKCHDLNPYDSEKIIHEIHEFEQYQEMLDYLNSVGFSIDKLEPAKGLKITF